MRMRRKRNLSDRLEKCKHLLVQNPEALYGIWAQTFSYSTVHLELGCGKGRFIVQTAKDLPDVFFVALEKYSNVLVSALELAIAEDIKNVRFINHLAEDLPNFFAHGEISRIYINFCDPWPLARHAKRRLTSNSFLNVYKDLLSDGGEILFKTDNIPLFEFSLRELKNSGYNILYVSHNLHNDASAEIMTEYEYKFYERGIPVLMCKAQIPERSPNQA